MEAVLAALLGLAAGVFAALVAVRRASLDPLRSELRALSERLARDGAAVEARLQGLDARLSASQSSGERIARGIFESLGDVRRAATAVAEQAREFSALQDLLRAPKARGALGEALLEELLRQVLPPGAYSVQHRFRTGTVVDAVVRAGGRLVPVDSKFPLSAYRRLCEATGEAERAAAERAFAADVDAHVRAIASRYILPDEGTFDFAVMYVPAEGVYGELLRLSHRGRPLWETALEARVVPMSPLTLHGYLQTVLYGLKGLHVEASARAVLEVCGRLQQDLERFADDYDTLGRHIANARSRHEDGRRQLDRLRDGLAHAADLTCDDAGVQPGLRAVGGSPPL